MPRPFLPGWTLPALLLGAGCVLESEAPTPVVAEVPCGSLSAQAFLSPEQAQAVVGCVETQIPSGPGTLSVVSLTYETPVGATPLAGQLCTLEGAGQSLLIGGLWRTAQAAPANLAAGCRDDGFGLCMPSAHDHTALDSDAYSALARQHLASTEWAACFRGPVRVDGGARLVPAPRLNAADTEALLPLGRLTAKLELISAADLNGSRKMLGALDSGRLFQDRMAECDDASIAAFGSYEGSWVVSCQVGDAGATQGCANNQVSGNVPDPVLDCVEHWFVNELKFPTTDGVRGVLGRVSASAQRAE